MTPEEMYAFEEQHGLPHMPPDPPAPKDPKNITHEEAQASVDHMIACFDVMMKSEVMLKDYDRAEAFKTVKDFLSLFGRAVVSSGRGVEIDTEVWDTIKSLNDKIDRQTRRIVAREEDDN